MINSNQKRVLIIDIENKTFEKKSFSDLNPYIGGVGMGLKLFQMYDDKDPVIFAIGPLNGFFPYASKTAIITQKDGTMEDNYVGGTLSSRMRFSGVDAIMIYGKSEEKVNLDISDNKVIFKDKDININEIGLPGKKSVIQVNKNGILLDEYFTTKEDSIGENLNSKNINSITITAHETIKIKDFDKYKAIYQKLLQKQNEMLVKHYRNPSCAGCPMGCRKSKEGEIGGNVLIHSLVACEFSESIYSDIGIVFSCLNVLGYDYTHEDIENLPKLIEEIIK